MFQVQNRGRYFFFNQAASLNNRTLFRYLKDEQLFIEEIFHFVLTVNNHVILQNATISTAKHEKGL